VHKVGHKRGKVVDAALKLHEGLDADVRGMPPLSGYTVVENALAGTALPLTPIYSERSDSGLHNDGSGRLLGLVLAVLV
jgi:hypothetical protein